jgi:ubiquinone/menaquinone biosynthesis C-methylase UbiE
MRALRALVVAGLAALGAALWWRKNPTACPYSQRFWVELPHPVITRERLRGVLSPMAGERILEVGPGTGYYTLELAETLGPEGRIDIFDLQPEMLDHTLRRAGERGLDNVVPTQGDATSLPYDDDSFDGALLVSVLGEIPDRDAALRELRRVLKPGGRLVVGEIAVDPHFTTFGSLRHLAEEAGLFLDGRSGSWLGYFARFLK